MFELFSDRARRVVVLAQEESRLLNHQRIGTEHLLLALLRIDGGATSDALRDSGASLEAARIYVERSHGRGRSEPSGHIPFTPRAVQTLKLAARMLLHTDGDTIGEPHLLHGLLELPECTACQVLLNLGVDTSALADAADRLARSYDGVHGSDTGHARAFAWDRASASTGGPGAGSVARARRMSAEEIVDQVDALVRLLASDRTELARGLRRYGRHDDDCQRGQGCSCGFDDLLAQLDSDSEGEE